MKSKSYRYGQWSTPLLAFLVVAVQPTLAMAQPTHGGVAGSNEAKMKEIAQNTEKLEQIAGGLRSLGEYYDDRTEDAGIKVARAELLSAMEDSTQKKIDEVRADKKMSAEAKNRIIDVLERTLHSDRAEIAISDNLYGFFDQKARRLFDRDFDLVPFGPGDNVGIALLEIFVWILIICSVVILLAILILAVSSPDPCYHCHYRPDGRRRFCHSNCYCRGPNVYP